VAIADGSGLNMSDLVRHFTHMIYMLQQDEDQGGQLFVRRPDGTEHRVTILSVNPLLPK
jgi:hypothetical protein